MPGREKRIGVGVGSGRLLLLLTLLLVAVAMVSLMLGQLRIPPGQIARILASPFFPVERTWTPTVEEAAVAFGEA